MHDARPFDELRSAGLLWLINRIVFHPRGWALGFVMCDGVAVGWTLYGDGREVWRFDGQEDDLFNAANETLRPIERPVPEVTPDA